MPVVEWVVVLAVGNQEPEPMFRELWCSLANEVVHWISGIPRNSRVGGLQLGDRSPVRIASDFDDPVEAVNIRRRVSGEGAVGAYARSGVAPIPQQRRPCLIPPARCLVPAFDGVG